MIVSGTDHQRSQILESSVQPQAPSASAPTTRSPHHKLTKRPGVATVTPIPSPLTTESLVTTTKTAASSTSLSIGISAASPGAAWNSRETIVNFSGTHDDRGCSRRSYDSALVFLTHKSTHRKFKLLGQHLIGNSHTSSDKRFSIGGESSSEPGNCGLVATTGSDRHFPSPCSIAVAHAAALHTTSVVLSSPTTRTDNW
jgi:hypothetical protein